MVDINLFKEDGIEGEEEKEWTPEPDDEEQPLEDALDEDFGSDDTEEIDKELEDDFDFGGEIKESSSLDEEGLLVDEEEMPEFDTPEENESDEEYTYGDISKRKTSPLLLVLLCVVAVGAALYQFVIYPQQLKKKQATSLIPKTPPDVNQLIADLQKKQTAERDSAVAEDGKPKDNQVVESSEPEKTVLLSNEARNLSISGYINKSNEILEHLSRQGQLGTIILKDKEFHIGYVSETPNASGEVERQIKSIFGIREVKISPEERHKTAGKFHYWGVISGNLPAKSQDQSQTQRENFVSPDALFRWIRNRASDSRLVTKQTESFAKVTVGNVQYTPVRVKTEGGKAESVQFLASLTKYYGNYILTKLVVAPVQISDFNARQVRVVLDFLVQI